MMMPSLVAVLLLAPVDAASALRDGETKARSAKQKNAQAAVEAQLNLADALWATDRFDKARTQYRAYTKAASGTRPARVDARLVEQKERDPENVHLVACALTGLPAGRLALSAEGGEGVLLLDWRREVAGGELSGVYFNLKYNVECKDRRVTVGWEAPYRSRTFITGFEWKGDALVRLSSREEDPSADAVAEAESHLAAGRVVEACDAYLVVGYPLSYFSAEEVSVRLWKLAKSKEERAAVLNFDEVFDVERPTPTP